MRRLLALALLAGACAPAWADDVRCLQSADGGKPIRMSLTLFGTSDGHLVSAGEVLYAGEPESLPIVFKSSEAVEDFENRSSIFLTTWLEVLPDEERIGGRYSFRHQGAVLFDFQYHNLRTGKTYHFEENRDVLDQKNSCNWP
ncbi:MAG TPA: hypothetical protein EYH47_12385 [Pseudomonas oleovorans]|uniref:hypothetical protein n=1 Tax=Ectopseudomonas khazarica TaxID=2502979 RepID=UPI0012DDA0C7|nr:hypothetical protein [Pseudomonas oleovorans]